jgi:hypothetical protein
MDRLMAFASSELAGRGAVSKLNLGAVRGKSSSNRLSRRDDCGHEIGQTEENGRREFR